VNNETHLGQRRTLPLLFVVGKEHRDSIPKTLMSMDLPPEQRIQVEELVVYETGVMGSFKMAFKNSLGQVLDTGRPEEAGHDEEDCHAIGKSSTPTVWIVVFSPTGCDIMLRTLGLTASSSSSPSKARLRRSCYIATIGPTTRDHLRSNFGIEPDVCAQRPSPEGLGAGIEEFMARRREEESVP
jgi:uroporphyrinogen-III synthase